MTPRLFSVDAQGDDGVFSGTSPWQMPQGGVDKARARVFRAALPHVVLARIGTNMSA